MKVFLRTIKGKEHEINCSEDDLVELLFEQCVEGFKPDFTRDSILLVFKGKMLQKDKAISTYGLKDDDRIVVMSQKKKDIGKAHKKKPVIAKKEEVVKEPVVVDTVTATATATAVASGGDVDMAEDVVPKEEVSDAMKTSLVQMQSMGFEYNESLKMLEITNGNVDQATALLLEGTASEEIAPTQEALDALNRVITQVPGEEHTLPEDHPLHELVTSEAFAEMRDVVRRDPAMLPQFIMEIFQANPDLVNPVLENELDFLKCLLGPDVPEQISALAGAAGVGPNNRVHDQLSDEAMAQLQRAQQETNAAIDQIAASFSSDDEAAIARLMELGFPRAQVIEAYMACEKNEEAAANFLFDF